MANIRVPVKRYAVRLPDGEVLWAWSWRDLRWMARHKLLMAAFRRLSQAEADRVVAGADLLPEPLRLTDPAVKVWTEVRMVTVGACGVCRVREEAWEMDCDGSFPTGTCDVAPCPSSDRAGRMR